jgi:drug/metabolite transporter (DMT)-like permease
VWKESARVDRCCRWQDGAVADPVGESLAAPPRGDAVLLVIALAGVSFSGPLIAATVAPALAIAFWRTAMASLLTVPAALLRHRSELAHIGRPALLAAGAAGVALALHFGTWVPSVTMTSVASATALVSTQSIFAALIAHFRGRRLPGLAWVGISVSTVATLLITGADVGLSGRAVLGDVLAVVGGLFAAIYVTIGAGARKTMSASTYTAICYASCSVLLLVVCLVGGVQLAGYSANAWVKIALVAICAQLLGHSLINVVLRSTSATVVSLAILFETPGAALVAYLWLHQRPPLTAIPGILMLFAGLVLVARSRVPELPVPAVE